MVKKLSKATKTRRFKEAKSKGKADDQARVIAQATTTSNSREYAKMTGKQYVKATGQTVFGTKDLQKVWGMSSTKNVRRVLRANNIRIGRGNEHKFNVQEFVRNASLYERKSTQS